MKDRKRKQKMKNRIKKFSTYEFSTLNYVKQHYVEKEVAVIKLGKLPFSSWIDPYSEKQPVLNEEVADYIKRITYNIPTFYQVEIRIEGNHYSSEEERLICDLIKNYFGLQVGDKMTDLNVNTIKAMILLLAGILFLGCFLILSYNGRGNLLLEIMSITGWFAIWEFVNTVWLERGKIQIERMNAGQLATSRVIFSKESD